MECKKNIKKLINNIDEFDNKYITYRAQTLRTILIDALEYIECKEQECEKLRSELDSAYRQVEDFDTIATFKHKKLTKYEQALDEIEKVLGGYYSNGISEIPQSQTELTISLLATCEAKLQKILSITQEINNN